MLLLRLAIIVQIMRAFVPPRTRNFTFWTGCGLIVANVLFWASITMLEIFSCSPMEKLWNPIIDGKCIDRHAYQVASAVMNMSSEMLILLLPQRVIWNLSLTKKQRLGLSSLFALGIAYVALSVGLIFVSTDMNNRTIVSSTLRLVYTVKMWPTDDHTYFIAEGITQWTIPEITCSLLVPCLPVMPQFVKMMRGKRSNGRRPPSMFGSPLSPSRRADPNRSLHLSRDNFVIRKTTELVVSDIEYHELVMRSNMSQHSDDVGSIAPWVRVPAHAHLGPLRPDCNTSITGMGLSTM